MLTTHSVNTRFDGTADPSKLGDELGYTELAILLQTVKVMKNSATTGVKFHVVCKPIEKIFVNSVHLVPRFNVSINGMSGVKITSTSKFRKSPLSGRFTIRQKVT